MITNALSCMLYPLWSYLFIVHLDLGVAGCALADFCNIIITLLCNLLYTNSLKDLALTRVKFSLRLIDIFSLID